MIHTTAHVIICAIIYAYVHTIHRAIVQTAGHVSNRAIADVISNSIVQNTPQIIASCHCTCHSTCHCLMSILMHIPMSLIMSLLLSFLMLSFTPLLVSLSCYYLHHYCAKWWFLGDLWLIL